MPLMSELVVLTAACATSFGLLVTVVWYAVTCTDRTEVSSAAPVRVPSAVGYAVAIPPELTVTTVPNQLPTTAKESGAPPAAKENEFDPWKNKGVFCRLKWLLVIATEASAVPFEVTGVLRAVPPVRAANPVMRIVEATVSGAEKPAVAGTVSAWLLFAPS